MESQANMMLTANDGMPWIRLTLDHTERIAALVTPELCIWRATDPTGRFFFSIGELVMHMADARFMFASQLDGEDYSDRYWAARQGPDERGDWKFREPEQWEDAVESLREGGSKIRVFLNQELNRLYEPTDGTRKFYKNYLDNLKAAGRTEQAAGYERRGVPTMARTLSAMACHEAGHRGSLQTMLRLNGVNTGE